MKSLFQLTGIIILIVVIAVVSGIFYVVDETEQVIITQFGEPVGEPITAAGLHLKIPLIQQVNVFDKRLLDWDGKANEIPTRDKKLIIVDTNARWKIVDPLLFLQSVGDLRTAQARLDDIIDSVTRDLVSSHKLVEVVRNSNELLDRIEERKEKREKDENTEFTGSQEVLEQIKDGREKLTADILEGCQKIVRDGFGLELVDVKIKRIIYVQEVLVKVYDRMVSERKRAAEQYRSEGQGKKAEIEGRMSKDLKEITSEAFRKAEEIRGEADAKVTKIYADAYGKDAEFYRYLKTLETYVQTMDNNVLLLLSTDNDYLKLLQSATDQ